MKRCHKEKTKLRTERQRGILINLIDLIITWIKTEASAKGVTSIQNKKSDRIKDTYNSQNVQ